MIRTYPYRLEHLYDECFYLMKGLHVPFSDTIEMDHVSRIETVKRLSDHIQRQNEETERAVREARRSR